MKKSELTQKQKEELEKFGANTWFVESLYKQYQENPSAVPDQWKNFFGNVTEGTKDNGSKNQKVNSPLPYPNIEMPKPDPDDDTQVIAGSFARIDIRCESNHIFYLVMRMITQLGHFQHQFFHGVSIFFQFYGN